uniref:Thioredoxin domain-containing protein n=2 Tax=Cuerna arida TaxID=1464854 RepID=A0A1B6F5V9_9HEMI
MAGKKGVAVALQAEINTEEEWQKLLEREGLIVVDVYSDWCGPCVGMVGNLKKLKLEIGSDYLHLAVAKSDGIEALKRFRKKSEPTWMFIAGGQMVNLMFGANAPRLMRMITQELEKETKVLAGQRERQGIPFSELTQEEKNRMEEIKRKEEAEKEREARELAEALEELKIRNLTRFAKLLLDKTVMVYFPHMIDENNTCSAAFKMLAQYDQVTMAVHDQMEVQITKEKIPEMFYNCEIKLSESFKEALVEKPCLVSLLMYHGISPDSDSPQPLYLGMVEEKLASFVYGVMSHTEPPVTHTVAYNFQETREDGEVWPGVWTPLNYLSKASAVKVLFPHTLVTLDFKEEELPPPRYCMIFDASRANEINDVIEEYSEDIVKVGFFDSMDCAVAKRVAKSLKQLEKLGPEKIKQTKMVMALAKRTSDPLLAFSQLTPLYISPDTKIGSKECDMFFPPPNVFEDEEEEGDEDLVEEQEEEAEEGGEGEQEDGEEGDEEEGEGAEQLATEASVDEKSLASHEEGSGQGSVTEAKAETAEENVVE